MKTEIQKIIKQNQSFMNETIEKYNVLKNVLTTNNLTPEKDFSFWINIKDDSIKNQIIQLGSNVNGIIKSVKITKAKEILQTLELDESFCMNVAKSQEFYSMENVIKKENGMELKTQFDELLKNYNAHSMDDKSYKKLHFIIDNFEQVFKIGRLRIFSICLLGITYKELEIIKQKCFDETYRKQIKVNVTVEEVAVISIFNKKK